MPIGKWLIRASDLCVKTLKLDAMDRYILEEYLASHSVERGQRFYFYHPETLRILKCPSFEEYEDAL